MNVGLVGSGPAAEAVRAALSDTDVSVASIPIGELPSTDLSVVVALAGSETLSRANEVTRRSGTPWISIEIGGVGGIPLDGVDVAVAGYTPETGCYDCLRTRVSASDPDRAEEARADRSAVRFGGALAGRELVTVLSRGESDLLGGLIEVPYTTRRLLPAPGCACESEPSQVEFDRYEARSVEESIARAERAVDPRVGLVGEIGEAESYPVPYYLATLRPTPFSDASAASKAAGVDAGWDAAYMKALGEALERYSAGVYVDERFDRGTVPETEGALSPEAFVRGRPIEESIPWVTGERLDTGELVRLPAEFVQFPPPERRFGGAITTGLGLGSSPVEATLSGLYEVIERDATMLSWYSTADPLALDVDHEGYETLSRRARSEDLGTTALLVTMDVDVPVVAVAVHREEGWPRFAVGSAADLDAVSAARSALSEALQNWTELRAMGEERANEQSAWIGEYASFPEAARGFVSAEPTVSATDVGPAEVPEGAGELESVVEGVVEAGLTPYVASVTPRDVRSLGFEAVRVMIPEAQPLFTSEPVFAERAREVPETMGFEPRLDREPHPYP
ncbi:YcaO-like family protein [Natronorarus salvus]|uniref:YcaO-like family protein n=1 Tax=Natronorarus salvus TaxID=3117733 RepID=UPI002F26ADC4